MNFTQLTIADIANVEVMAAMVGMLMTTNSRSTE